MPGVFLPHRGPVERDQWLIAGMLWAGQDAVLTGLTAVRLVGAGAPSDSTLMRFLVPARQHPRSTGRAVTLRTRRMPAGVKKGDLRVAPLERAWVDANRFGELPNERVRALTIALLQQGKTTPERLVAELHQGRPNDTLGVRQGVEDFATGAWSLPEVWLHRCIAGRHRRWKLLLNHDLFTRDGRHVGIPDAYLPEFGVVVQVHSQQFHAGFNAGGGDAWASTAEADNRYEAVGLSSLSVAPVTLRDHPRRFLDELDLVVAARSGLPIPDLVARRQPGKGTQSRINAA